MRTLFAVLALTMSAGLAKADDEHSFWWYQEAKIACMGDVMRLCREFVPDEDQVRTCMKTKRAQVSSSCAEFYPGGKHAD
jgi:hypothetical protein